jgi:hypothetical protein
MQLSRNTQAARGLSVRFRTLLLDFDAAKRINPEGMEQGAAYII